MQQYSKDHYQKAYAIDGQMSELIDNMTSSDHHRTLLLAMWHNDVISNENISHQLWKKRSNFLTNKKPRKEKKIGTTNLKTFLIN